MVVGILIVGLQQVMIYILAGQFGLSLIQLHSLQFQHYHGTRSILRKRLVNFDPDFFTRYHFPAYQVTFN